MSYATEIRVIRRSQLPDGFTTEIEADVYLNDQQPELDPGDLYEALQAIVQALQNP